MALAITPQGEFGDLPNCGKASNRGSRPYFGSDRSSPRTILLTGTWRRQKKEPIENSYQFYFNCYPWCA